MIFRSIVIAAGLCLAVPALAAPLPKTLIVGVYPSYPPLDVKDPATGKIGGFDVVLGKALAKRMGTHFKLQETNFAQFVASVETGRIDMFFNGMNDTAKRRQLISFVDYLRSGTQFMVRAGDAAKYADPEALCGKKVSASRGTTIPAAIARWSKRNCVSKGKPAIVFFGADNSIDARSELKQGRVDAMAQDSLTIPYIRSQEKGTYVTVGAPFDNTVMGIGLARNATALQDALKSALQAMIDDGSYAKLLAKSNLPATSAIPAATINKGM